jgi:hypothetical protein
MTVQEVADHFRRLNEANPSYPPGLPCPPGYEQALGRSVLDWVWAVVGHPQRYAVAARWYAAAFTADPQLLAGPPPSHRYLAACAAARAGCGQGRDAGELDEESRAGFRRQALDWLWAELVSWRRLLEQEPGKALVVADDMRYWFRDPHFAGVHGPEALARLPAAERQAWQKLWSEVENTLMRAQERPTPGQKAAANYSKLTRKCPGSW